MKVFIENEAGSNQKNIYDEKSLNYKKTVKISREYPYPYGFLLDTTSGDGDNLDAFVITKNKLKTGQIVECDPVGLMEQTERLFKDGVEEVDHNVLMILEDDCLDLVNDEVKTRLKDFVLHAFDHIRPNKNYVGDFLDKNTALQYIKKCKDK